MKAESFECPMCGKSDTLVAVTWGLFCVGCSSTKGVMPEPTAPTSEPEAQP